MKYYIAIADIHGEIDKLNQALERCQSWISHNIMSDDTVQFVFLGDLCDRGPDSNAVIAKVKEYVEKGAILCIGNHDMFLIGTAEGDAEQAKIWGFNGGLSTCLQMYGEAVFREKPLSEIVQFGTSSVHDWADTIKESWQYKFYKDHAMLYYESDYIFFCHAPQSNVKEPFTAWHLTWGRRTDFEHGLDDRIFKVPNNKRMSVHGHFHRLQQGQSFPRFHNYIHSGIARTVVCADSGCGCADFGRLKPVIIRENGKYPEVDAIL